MLRLMGGGSATQFAIALTVLSGCDVVWGLVREDAAVVDSAPLDTPTGCGPLEHDEDGDLIADRCDNCPAVSNNPPGADQDQDGVGDICDPQVDRFSPRFRFMPFDAIPSDLALTPNGVWSIEADALLVGPTVVQGDYIATWDAKSANVVVRTRARLIGAAPPVGGTHSFGLWAEVDLGSAVPAFPTGTVFELIDDGKHYAHLVETQQQDVPKSVVTPEDLLLFQMGSRYDMQMLCTTMQPVCIATLVQPPNLLKFTDSSKPAHSRAGAVGLRIHGDITVAFEYLEVFASAP
jgi:hypothetical protein